jgi:hypothetical protein
MCDPLFTAYPRGARRDVDWGTGVHPDAVDAFQSPTTMFVETGLGDGPHDGHLSFDAVAGASLTLSREGQVIATKPDVFGFFPIPNGAADFQLDSQVTLKPEALAVSRSASTTWRFHNGPPPDPTQQSASTPPLIRLDYAPDVDPLGYAHADRPLTFAIGVSHLETPNPAPPPPDVTGATFAYSVDDGATWTTVGVRQGSDGRFVAVVPARVLRAGTSVSVHAGATDAAGGSIDQHVIGMVPVR